jgi:hypothetical protein
MRFTQVLTRVVIHAWNELLNLKLLTIAFFFVIQTRVIDVQVILYPCLFSKKTNDFIAPLLSQSGHFHTDIRIEAINLLIINWSTTTEEHLTILISASKQYK